MDMPYAKISLYILAFIGCLNSGYGSSRIGSKEIAKSKFNVLFNNAKNVANQFKYLKEVLQSALEGDCVFKCPNNALPKLNESHVSRSNGCGSLQFSVPTQLFPVKELTKCCNMHDICYDTCNRDRKICDLEFRECLFDCCKSRYTHTFKGILTLKACKGVAKVLFKGTSFFGCKSYMDAQEIACLCPAS